MDLQLIGKDPGSPGDGSPSVFDAGDDYVVQGWVLDPATLAQLGDLPAGETVVRIPKRLMAVFPEVNGGAAGGGVH